jgi:hypothetical protein
MRFDNIDPEKRWYNLPSVMRHPSVKSRGTNDFVTSFEPDWAMHSLY